MKPTQEDRRIAEAVFAAFAAAEQLAAPSSWPLLTWPQAGTCQGMAAVDEAFLKDLQGLADTWRSYVARNKEQAVVMSTQGYLSGLEICADQLESELKRIRDLVRDDG